MPTGPETVHLIVHSDSRVETSLINGNETTVYKEDYLASEVKPHGRTIESNLFLINVRNARFNKKLHISDEAYEELSKIVMGMDTVVQPEYEFEQSEFLRTAKIVQSCNGEIEASLKGEQDDDELVKALRERAGALYNASRLYDSDAEDAAILYKAADAIEQRKNKNKRRKIGAEKFWIYIYEHMLKQGKENS